MAMWRRATACLFIGTMLLLPRLAAALDSSISLQDYNHTSWTTKDGAPAEIGTMAQTPDGWLWLGTLSGLYKFDGIRFERYPLPTYGVPARERIHNLDARPNGDLWITDEAEGLSVIRSNGTIEDIATDDKMGAIHTLAFDVDGSVWATCVNGLFHRVDGKWLAQGANTGLPANKGVWSMLIDQRNRFWISNEEGVLALNRSTGKFEKTNKINDSGRARVTLIQSPGGEIWAIGEDHLDLVSPLADEPPLPRNADFNRHESHHFGLFDNDGNLWARHGAAGITIVANADHGTNHPTIPSQHATAILDQEWQMSGLNTSVMLEDQEGDIWIATSEGLDRFRENKLQPAHMPDKIGAYTMASDTAGNTFAADPVNGRVWQLNKGMPPQLAPGFYGQVANDNDGALLLAGRGDIERRYRGKVEKIPLPTAPNGTPASHGALMMLHDGKVLWVVTIESSLQGLVNGHWLPFDRFGLPSKIFLIRAGDKGQLWLSCADDSIVFYDNGKQTRYDGPKVGLVSDIYPGKEILVAGSEGLALLSGQHFRKIHALDPAALTGISGIVMTPNGDYWLNGGQGILHVRKDDWLDMVNHPETMLHYELFNAKDAYTGRAMLLNRSNSIFSAPDGQLWFMTSSDIVHLDPNHLKRNTVAPHAEIQQVNVEGRAYSGQSPLLLPQSSQNFSVQFTAPSLNHPESMHFQYQLIGVDSDWQDSKERRTAFYTNVAPGKYHFKVKARNEDDLPSLNEADLSLEIAPAFQQTISFKIFSGVVIAGLLYALYLFRLKIVTTRVAARLQVRMDERERIARTLHDTILQNVHATILHFQSVTDELAPGSVAREKMEKVLDQASTTYLKGRDEVHELRAGQISDVEAAIADAGQQLILIYPNTKFNMLVDGERIRLQSQVAEETCEIAREAIRNAFRHANAASVNITLKYRDDQFKLMVIDDGVGMISKSADGLHWGLIGMRERAGRIGAKLLVHSAPNGGTQISLTIPARLSYVNRGFWRKLSVFKRES